MKTADEAQEIADSIGYPVIIKAVAGGGGRGMNVVRKPEELPAPVPDHPRDGPGDLQGQRGLHRALPEAPRHTEVQLVCDRHGNGVYFFERDCSVQRRHQKLIEEAPSIHLTPTRGATSASARCAARCRSATPAPGTMEFLLDDEGNFDFMEMNAPHPGRAPGDARWSRAST